MVFVACDMVFTPHTPPPNPTPTKGCRLHYFEPLTVTERLLDSWIALFFSFPLLQSLIPELHMHKPITFVSQNIEKPFMEISLRIDNWICCSSDYEYEMVHCSVLTGFSVKLHFSLFVFLTLGVIQIITVHFPTCSFHFCV